MFTLSQEKVPGGEIAWNIVFWVFNCIVIPLYTKGITISLSKACCESLQMLCETSSDPAHVPENEWKVNISCGSWESDLFSEYFANLYFDMVITSTEELVH